MCSLSLLESNSKFSDVNIWPVVTTEARKVKGDYTGQNNRGRNSRIISCGEWGKLEVLTRKWECSEHRSKLRDWGIINSKDALKNYKDYFLNLAFSVHPTDLDHFTIVNTIQERTYSELFVMEAKRFPKHCRLLVSIGCFPETEGEFWLLTTPCS